MHQRASSYSNTPNIENRSFRRGLGNPRPEYVCGKVGESATSPPPLKTERINYQRPQDSERQPYYGKKIPRTRLFNPLTWETIITSKDSSPIRLRPEL